MILSSPLFCQRFSSEWWGLQELGPLLDQDDQGAQVE
jgi:hypothetical protein